MAKKNILFVVIIAVIVIAGIYKFSGKDMTQKNLKSKAHDIGTTELANFFNNLLDCSSPKLPNPSSTCFTDDFKSVNIYGAYDNPLFQSADFTGDGSEDVLVTIYYSGSGSMRDFYAVTNDPKVTGSTRGDIDIAYRKEGEGFSKSNSNWSNSDGSYILTCPDSNKDGKADCTTLIYWDSKEKTFTEKHTAFQ